MKTGATERRLLKALGRAVLVGVGLLLIRWYDWRLAVALVLLWLAWWMGREKKP